jgi:hypothetical protein
VIAVTKATPASDDLLHHHSGTLMQSMRRTTETKFAPF